MQKWWNKTAEGETSNGPAGRRQPHSFPPVTGPLRHLSIAASSVLLDRFDRTLRKLGKNTLVEDTKTLRPKGFNAHHFITLVKRAGDPETSTGLEKLRFLA